MTTSNTEHRQGCDALGGYGHGVGPCTCGATTELATQARNQAQNLDTFGRELPPEHYTFTAGLLRQLAAAVESKADPVETVTLGGRYTRDGAHLKWHKDIPDGVHDLYAAPVQQESKPEPVGYMNAGHVHELQQRRIGYAYIYPEEGTGASVAVYAAPVQPEKGERKPSVCAWTYEDEPTYAWHTGCGNLWAFTDGGPEDNGTRFCPYCGGSVGIGSSTEGGGNV